MDQKYSEVADHNLSIGLRNPDDRTVKQTLAMIFAVDSGAHKDPVANYHEVGNFKRKMLQKRKMPETELQQNQTRCLE